MRKIRITLTFCIGLLFCMTICGGEMAADERVRHCGAMLERHATTNRAFQGISSMAVSERGRLWVTWYAGRRPGEGPYNYVVLATSNDGGGTWEQVLVVDPDDDGWLRCFDPEVWIDPQGRLWLTWAQAISIGKHTHTWAVVAESAECALPQWSEPRILAPGVMMCKPIVLRDGTWVFPIADWESRYQKIADAPTSGCWVSTDQGASFNYRGSALIPMEDRSCDEHMFVERLDGTLWCLTRTRYGIGESFSTDGGKSWSLTKPSAIAHPTARFFITRLASGNLLLVKHGPIGERIGRSHLTAFVSCDDGKSWGGGLLLDERNGVSYPDGQQAADGTIYITYDYSRSGDRTILFSSFREEDALAGRDVSGKVMRRVLVNQASGGQSRKRSSEKPKPVYDNANGVALDRKSPGEWHCAQKFEFKRGSKLFRDRSYTVAEVPKELEPAYLVMVDLDGIKTVSCAQAGMLYVLTPLRERNSSNVGAELLKYGFKKVALPEVRLFNPGHPGNYCTLYQKRCRVGEKFMLGKWFVPLCLKK
jgi:hypothetical protein